MTSYRNSLSQLANRPFLTDGGLETTLVFAEGLELPHFAAFERLRTQSGTQALRRYFDPYLEIARNFRVGFILESPTWRASADWGERPGYTTGTDHVDVRTAERLALESSRPDQSLAARDWCPNGGQARTAYACSQARVRSYAGGEARIAPDGVPGEGAEERNNAWSSSPSTVSSWSSASTRRSRSARCSSRSL